MQVVLGLPGLPRALLTAVRLGARAAGWFLLFAARLLVQVPLYLAHTDAATSALALTKLLMGVPLYAPLLLVTWFVVKGQFPQKPQQAPRSSQNKAG